MGVRKMLSMMLLPMMMMVMVIVVSLGDYYGRYTEMYPHLPHGGQSVGEE